MCSILCIIDKGAAPNPGLVRLAERLLVLSQARGPDDSACLEPAPNVVLGSNRLSIVDRSSDGRMPMSTPDGRAWIVFNGEIYNHDDLRSQLRSRGHTFRSRSDTEVVLHAYLEWGDSFASQLNGLFAVVIYDARNRRLFAARDRFGIKPLFVCESDQHLVLSSDFRVFHDLPGLRPHVDPEAVANYMRLRFVPAPSTIFAEVEKLKPAEARTWGMGSFVSTTAQFWKPRFDLTDLDQTETRKAFEEHLVEAVSLSCSGDVAPSVLLSGGIDSSSIVWALRELGRPVQSFSCTFVEELLDAEGGAQGSATFLADAIDETGFADQVARRFGTDHRNIRLGEPPPGAEFSQFLAALGEPMASIDALGNYWFAKALTDQTKVMFSGLGSDEILGGYDGMYFHSVDDIARVRSDPAYFGRLFSGCRDGDLDPLQFLRPDLRRDDACERVAREAMSGFPWAEFPAETSNQIACFELGIDLPGWELEQADRLYMNASIEVRPPFLENEFVDFALQIPTEWKRNKLILKEVMRGKLPDAVVERRKYPSLGTPKKLLRSPWFRELARDLVENPADIWDRDALSSYLRRPEQTWDLDLLYRLVSLQQWIKAFLPT